MNKKFMHGFWNLNSLRDCEETSLDSLHESLQSAGMLLFTRWLKLLQALHQAVKDSYKNSISARLN